MGAPNGAPTITIIIKYAVIDTYAEKHYNCYIEDVIMKKQFGRERGQAGNITR